MYLHGLFHKDSCLKVKLVLIIYLPLPTNIEMGKNVHVEVLSHFHKVD